RGRARATLCPYTTLFRSSQSRYKWGKLVDCEPSRFIEEIDDKYLEYSNPDFNKGYRYKPSFNIDIFGDVDKSKLRQTKPVGGTPPKWAQSDMQKPDTVRNLRKLKPTSSQSQSSTPVNDSKLAVGNIVLQERFGKGQILNIEGVGADKKAEIKFDVGGIKKLLLRFAKLDVIG